MTGGWVRVSRGASSFNSISYSVETSVVKAPGVGAVSGANCGMWIASLGDVSIGCGGCNSRYHTIRICLWLPERVINAIKQYGGRDVNFSCTSLVTPTKNEN